MKTIVTADIFATTDELHKISQVHIVVDVLVHNNSVQLVTVTLHKVNRVDKVAFFCHC